MSRRSTLFTLGSLILIAAPILSSWSSLVSMSRSSLSWIYTSFRRCKTSNFSSIIRFWILKVYFYSLLGQIYVISLSSWKKEGFLKFESTNFWIALNLKSILANGLTSIIAINTKVLDIPPISEQTSIKVYDYLFIESYFGESENVS